MSLSRTNPLSIATTAQLDSVPVKEQVDELYERVKTANDARRDWIVKQEKLLRQRRGIRKPKVFPWPGANNHNWPLTDGIIRRWKPGMVALVTQADPVSFFYGTKPEAVTAAPDAQSYYHWHFHRMAGMRRTAMELVDAIAQYGIAYTRQGWEYATERRCRVVQAAALFPGGPQAATDQYNQQIAAMRQQAEAAVAAGQASPDALQQLPSPLATEDYVRQTLEDEYLLKSDDPLEGDQLEAAVEAVLSGAEQVKFHYRVIVADRPAWAAVSPLDVVVPPRTRDVSLAEFVGLLHRMDADLLQQMALDGHFAPDRVQPVIAHLRSRSQSDPEHEGGFGDSVDTARTQITDVLDRADGISQGVIDEPEITFVLELYCRLDIDGDGVRERCVLWYHPDTHAILALYYYPYSFRRWPVVQFEYEHVNPRPWGARGISELNSVFQATVNKLHNARLDAAQITLSPSFQVRAVSGQLPRNIKFMPGSMIPVSTVGDIAPLPVDTSGLLQSLAEENTTKRLAEEYVGIFDPGILAQNSAERRTATEVEAVVQTSQSVFGQDAELFQDSMAEVHRQLWQLIQDFAPAEEFYRVTGEPQPKLARKHELDFEYDIIPAGTPANTSKPLAVSRAREALQIFGPDQSGVINRHELYKHYFDVLDPNLGKRVVRSPEEAAAVQRVMQLLQQAAEETGEQVPPTP